MCEIGFNQTILIPAWNQAEHLLSLRVSLGVRLCCCDWSGAGSSAVVSKGILLCTSWYCQSVKSPPVSPKHIWQYITIIMSLINIRLISLAWWGCCSPSDQEEDKKKIVAYSETMAVSKIAPLLPTPYFLYSVSLYRALYSELPGEMRKTFLFSGTSNDVIAVIQLNHLITWTVDL